MLIDWSLPMTLVSPLGELDINSTSGDRILTIPELCDPIGQDVRAGRDYMPQEDGAVFHNPRFKGGIVVNIAVQLLKDDALALGSDRQSIYDELLAHVDALYDASGRLRWLQTGAMDERMLLELWTLARPAPTGGLLKTIRLAFESPFPYAIAKTQTSTDIDDGDTETLEMTGNVFRGVFPVAKLHGPVTSAVELRNNTTGRTLVYDPALPGASTIGSGHYVEFDFFRNSAVLDGDVTDRFAGVDVLNSDFWTLVPGENEIEAVGADWNVLWNHGYA